MISEEDKLFTHMESMLSGRQALTSYLRSDAFIYSLMQAESNLEEATEEVRNERLQTIKVEVTRLISINTNRTTVAAQPTTNSSSSVTEMGFFTPAKVALDTRDILPTSDLVNKSPNT